jgi:beta-lactamase superfamily II metal-dependent hydrolase
VGHGTAIAVRAPGVPALVFDAGSRDRPQVARRALLPLLADWDAGSVAIVASHADRDHASALPWLAERLDVEFWAGAGPEECRARLPDTAWRADCAAGWIELAPPRAPPDLRLWLVRGAASADNEGSRSLVVEARGARFLLAGDAEDQGIAGFVAGSPGPPGHGPWRLITLPHHGSDGPRLGRLLTALAPAEVWVSCAGEPDAAAELERRGLAWRSTNAAGPLRLEHPRARAADSVYEPRASAADSVSNAVGED